jgi:DNA modification methylase
MGDTKKCSSTLHGMPRPRHLLFCGDCRDPQSWQKLLDAGADLPIVVFTSPPYASQRKYDEASEFRPIPPEEYSDWWDAVQAGVRDVLAADGSFFVNIKEHCEDGDRHIYCKELLVRHVREWGWRWIEEYAWTHGGTPRAVVNRFKNGWEPVWHLVLGEAFRFRPDAVRHEYHPDQTGTRVESYGGGHPCDKDCLDGQNRTAARKAGRPDKTFKFRPQAVRHEVDPSAIPDWGATHPCQEGGVSAQPGGRNYEASKQDRKRRKQIGSNAKLQGSSAGGRMIHEVVAEHSAEVGLAYPSNVLSVGRNREALGHGAAFPVALPTFFVRAYSDPYDTIADPFMGSGSTAIAAAQEGRFSLGIEISPKYMDVIRRRITRWLRAHDLATGVGVLEEPAVVESQQVQP